MAVRLFIERQQAGEPQPIAFREPAPKVKRQTYRRDWPNYNLAQTNEKRYVCELLADLCKVIEEPARKPGPGRPPLSLADSVFVAVYKVFSTVSARRFMCDLEEAHRDKHIKKLPHFNAALKALEDHAVTPILHEMIRQSSLPLKEVEMVFAPDSSGFCTSKFIRWFDVRYGVTREEARWVKVHLMCGCKTNVVTAVVIEDQYANDCPQLPKLVKATAQGFKIKEVPADKAYLSSENLQAVEDVGGTAYIPFKRNSTGSIGGIYEKAFHYFCLHREEFLKHYHQRSNAESTFSMIKRKLGDALRSKTETAMVNEALAKILCHNLCCLVSAWYELGIESVFCKPGEVPEMPAVLKFPG
jgi:transposase